MRPVDGRVPEGNGPGRARRGTWEHSFPGVGNRRAADRCIACTCPQFLTTTLLAHGIGGSRSLQATTLASQFLTGVAAGGRQ